MKKKNINLFILGAVVLTLALFGCNSGKTADTTAAGALIDGAALYNSDCIGCHGSLAKSGKRGVSVTQIQDAISHNWGGMGAFAILTADQLQAIATALSAPVTTTPDTTTATDTPTSSTDSLDGAALYSSNCQNCHNPLASSTKAGRTATQIQAGIAGNYGGMGRYSNLTTAQVQAIADALATVPALTPASSNTSNSTDGAALYTSYCSSCHGQLANSNKKNATVSQIQAGIGGVSGMRSISLTTAQLQAIATALGTTPTSAPASAPGTTDGAALYTSYCSSCHGQLASSNKKNATVSQIQAGIGSVSGMRSISLTTAQLQAIATALGTTPTSAPASAPGTTDGAALYTSYCSSCHGQLASSNKKNATVSQIQAGIGSVSGMRSISLTTAQLQAIATALGTTPTSAPASAPGTTDGAALYTSYCSSCHGQLASSNKKNATVSQIQAGIGSVSGMRSISLTTAQLQAIATALGTTPTSAPASAPGTTDGAALYTQYCSGCHGNGMKGSSASSIQSAINSVSEMRSLSLTSAQIQAIATGGTVPASTTTSTSAPVDGAALYTTYCSGCHGALATSGHRGATVAQIQTGINTISGMMSLSTLTAAQIQAISTALGSTTSTSTSTPTTFVCGSCHTIPPSSGHHSYHVNSQGLSCSTCHGTGYSKTTVNSTTHNNGVVNISSTPGWNPSTRSCSNSCHGTERW